MKNIPLVALILLFITACEKEDDSSISEMQTVNVENKLKIKN